MYVLWQEGSVDNIEWEKVDDLSSYWAPTFWKPVDPQVEEAWEDYLEWCRQQENRAHE